RRSGERGCVGRGATLSGAHRSARAAGADAGDAGMGPPRIPAALDRQSRPACSGHAAELARAMTSPAVARLESDIPRSRVALLDLAGRAWPPLLLTALVLVALGQFLQVGLVSTDWWPVISTNRVQNLSK